MNEFAEANDGFGYLIECVQHLPALFATVVPWLSGAQHKELTSKYRYRADWCFIVKDRGAGSVTIDENGQATALVSVHRRTRPAQLPRSRGDGHPDARGRRRAADLRRRSAVSRPGSAARISRRSSRRSTRSRSARAAPRCSLRTRCAAQSWAATRRPPSRNPVANCTTPTGVWIADASGMPTCSGVNPMVSTMALARRTRDEYACYPNNSRCGRLLTDNAVAVTVTISRCAVGGQPRCDRAR